MRPDGGDPERDDYGLPRVDVVIPDDARELDGDLLAYRREERRRRRRTRFRRTLGPVARFGPVPPIIAVALLLGLASLAVLTVLAPRPVTRPAPTSMPRAPTASPGMVGGPLPADRVTVAGESRPLGDVAPGVIMIVPPACRCEHLVTDLADRLRRLDLKFWLAADLRRSDRPAEDLRELAAGAPAGRVTLVEDARNVLAAAYRPATTGPAPTAVLVHTDAVVGDVITPVTGLVLTERLRSLTRPSRP